jgi:putative peptidoglycan lipid II flippase
VQLPLVLRLARGLRLQLGLDSPHVRQVLHGVGPVLLGRGVVQISAYIDGLLASFLSTGAVTALYNAQTIYLLPVSLFGMSVSAAELPLMSGTTGSPAEIHAALRARLDAGLRRIAFFVVPSAVLLLALGDVVTAIIYQTGRFGHADSQYVWGILAGSAAGLLASTSGRLYAATFYALRDTRTPLRFASMRVVLSTLMGYLAAFHLPGLLGLERRWGVAGLTVVSGIAGWIEFALLRRSLGRRIGRSGPPPRLLGLLWGAAAVAAVVGWAVKWGVAGWRPLLSGPCVLLAFALTYFLLTWRMGVEEGRLLWSRLAGLVRRSTG